MATITIGPEPGRVFERIATLTSSTGLTAATYDVSITSGTTGEFDRIRHPSKALVQCEGFTIKWTVDGTTPTVTAGTNIGFLAAVGDFIEIEGYENIAKFRCINAVASSGSSIQVAYFY